MVWSETNQPSEVRSPSEDIIDYSVSNTGLTWTTEEKAFIDRLVLASHFGHILYPSSIITP
jgi:precorrin isomerase